MELALLPDRAVWWASERVLLVADVHLGKPASFRAGGVPAPEGLTDKDLARLGALLDTTGAERLIVLGDLAHDRHAWTEQTRARTLAWRDARPSLSITLVRGNHDRRASDPPVVLGIECVDPGWSIGGLSMRHEPDADTPTPALAGHLHPGVTLRSVIRGASLRSPCFWFTEDVGVLPAFGTFTGIKTVRPSGADRVFAVRDGVVLETPAALCVAQAPYGRSPRDRGR